MKKLIPIILLITLTSCECPTTPVPIKHQVTIEVRNNYKREEKISHTVEVLISGLRTKHITLESGNPITIELNQDRYLIRPLDQLEYHNFYTQLKGISKVVDIRKDTLILVYAEVN